MRSGMTVVKGIMGEALARRRKKTNANSVLQDPCQTFLTSNSKDVFGSRRKHILRKLIADIAQGVAEGIQLKSH
jgi:hypothetical protein